MHQSNSHEALLTYSSKIPSPKEHRNIFMKHFSKSSYKPTSLLHGKVMKFVHKIHLETTAHSPFTFSDTSGAI